MTFLHGENRYSDEEKYGKSVTSELEVGTEDWMNLSFIALCSENIHDRISVFQRQGDGNPGLLCHLPPPQNATLDACCDSHSCSHTGVRELEPQKPNWDLAFSQEGFGRGVP